MEKRQQICGLTPADIEQIISSKGINSKYAEVIATAFYRKAVRELEKIDKLPGSVKKVLISLFETGLNAPVASITSSDRSVKYLFTAGDGKEFETVFIPDGKRRTVCVSTQSGCRMGCPFCLTSGYGFRGNLSSGEIINQVLSIPEAGSVTHVVFMGMGEPFDNTGEVLKACNILTSQWGMAMSPRNITVSTVGIIDGVRRFLDESDCNLTLSLFSPFSSERLSVIPAEKANPSKDIISIIKSYKARKKRRFSIAYVMIAGINDTDEHLKELINILAGSSLRVNLLPYHPAGNDRFSSSDITTMQYFRQKLFLSGISASVRRSRGSDISAACGLLAGGLKKTINLHSFDNL
jgi:23S rRNA (adenine2503-C2)-methyltransferase